MGGSSSRNKGHSFEREIAVKMRDTYPASCRGDQRKHNVSRAVEADVEGTPFHIECKREKKQPNALKALEQADANRRAVNDDGVFLADYRPSVAVTKKDRGPILVTMYFDDWLELVAKKGTE